MLSRISKNNDSCYVPTYASVDSAPQGFAISRPSFICPLFLLFFGLSAITLLLLPRLDYYYALILGSLTGVNITSPLPMQFRLLFISFACTFWLFSAGNWLKRFKLFFLMIFSCTIAILLSDLFMVVVSKFNGPGPFSLAGHILSGYMALLAIAITITYQIHLPDSVIVHSKIKRPTYYVKKFFLSIILAALVTIIILNIAEKEIDFLKNIALLGGLGPGLLLFSPLLMIVLFSLGAFRKKLKFSSESLPSVAFLVAALNEEEHIADCIRSLDDAASKYPGISRLYLVDNGSRDKTTEIAKYEIKQCRWLKGELIICPKPGKAHALNLGLKNINEEILIRVDADTKVKNDILIKISAYFSDPTVGGVGGIPLPKNPSPLLAKMRSVEVYYNVGFLRIGQNAVDAVTVIPGIMSAYRRDLLNELGGFSEGLNGEDTDITVRVGRLGYQIVVDPTIEVYSEVPKTFAHLREQRLRWSRSFLHVFARNKSAIRMLQGVRGCWILPLGYVATFRRTFVIPILIFALIVAIIDPTALSLRNGAAISAVVVGPVALLTIIVLLIYRRLDLIPHISSYLALRIIRAYIALEMLFTLPLKD